MKLRKDQVPKLSNIIYNYLESHQLIQAKAESDAIKNRIVTAIIKSFSEEADLDAEAEKLLERFKPQIQAGHLNEHEMFLKIKKELAKKKGIAL